MAALPRTVPQISTPVRGGNDADQMPQPNRPARLSPDGQPCGCNTRIEYLYRDGGNFKQYEVIVVAGILSTQEQRTLRGALLGDCFVPEQVGMRPLQADLRLFGPGSDDAWHEIASISTTTDPATFPETAQGLLTKFRSANWNPSVSSFPGNELQTPPAADR